MLTLKEEDALGRWYDPEDEGLCGVWSGKHSPYRMAQGLRYFSLFPPSEAVKALSVQCVTPCYE